MLKIYTYNDFSDINKLKIEIEKSHGKLNFFSENIFLLQTTAETLDIFNNKKNNYYIFLDIDEYFLNNGKKINWTFIIKNPELYIVLIKKNDLSKGKDFLPENAEVVDISVSEIKEKLNLFELTDALLIGDKKSAWILLDKFEKNGEPAELVFFTLWWQIKMLISYSVAKDKNGFSPFVNKKSSSYINKNGNDKVFELKDKIIKLYNEDRTLSSLGLYDLMKKFILEA